MVLILDATDFVGSKILAALFDLRLRRRVEAGVVTGGAFSFFGFVGVPKKILIFESFYADHKF